MFTCGWCGTHYQTWSSQCASCGGPMPAPVGIGLGPEPPPPPRKLPEGFVLRVWLTRNVLLLIGLGFSVIGGFMTAALVHARTWAALFPVFFLLGGLSMMWQGVKDARRTLDAFRNGRAVEGKVAAVREDTSTTVNNRHPWNIVYTFQAAGYAYEGKVTTFESATANRFYGSPPIWVLVVENEPERNTIYPPIR